MSNDPHRRSLRTSGPGPAEIDGHVYLRDVSDSLKPGDIIDVRIEDADEHDLFGVSV